MNRSVSYIRYISPTNILVSPPDAVWNPEKPGTLSETYQLVKFLKNRGWEWGGDWLPKSGRTDYQHFQKLI
ncbi:MAG TPA: M15 family metallopeptidase [Candidatus Saccharimonadales bacterium]